MRLGVRQNPAARRHPSLGVRRVQGDGFLKQSACTGDMQEGDGGKSAMRGRRLLLDRMLADIRIREGVWGLGR